MHLVIIHLSGNHRLFSTFICLHNITDIIFWDYFISYLMLFILANAPQLLTVNGGILRYLVLRPRQLKATRNHSMLTTELLFGSFYHKSSDGWAFTNNVDIKQHQTLGDRLSAAQILVDLQPCCPVVVDDMSNVTASKYGAIPERLYVLQAGKVVYKVGRRSSVTTHDHQHHHDNRKRV